MEPSNLSPQKAGYKPLLLVAPLVLLIIWFSCVDAFFFRRLYESCLLFLPLPDEWLLYLSKHYKIGHSLCYALLTAITCLCLRNRTLLTILLVFSLGLLLEVVQHFLPTRAGSFVDLGYNLLGVLVGAGIVWVLKTFISRGDAETAEKS